MSHNIFVYPNRCDAGLASAAMASAIIRAAIEEDGAAGVVFAAAPSQNEFLAALRDDASIDWRRVTASIWTNTPVCRPAILLPSADSCGTG